jgi:hypothetical protein
LKHQNEWFQINKSQKMKNSKSGRKSKKESKVKDSVKNKKVSIRNFAPREEDIREKANELYMQRLDRGEHGTAENDWIEAEKFLMDTEG